MIYEKFVIEKGYSKELQNCIKSTVDNLIANRTDFNSPGMLLGKIQSGKTRAFIGIIALSFDKGYDICVVFTKGTKALAEQTLNRMNDEFNNFIEEDEVKVYDIMSIPQITSYLKKQKLIFIVKKETNNLDRLVKMFRENDDLTQKKVLFIDDEADFASIGFKRDNEKEDGVSINVLAAKINGIKKGFEQNYSFLQVTATPYSLYLQPSGKIELNGDVFEPIKPTFTTLVPVHEKYIGGKQYFEESQDSDSFYSKLYIRVPDVEIAVLNRRDQRYISNILTSPNLEVFRRSIINYLVGGSIRIIQSRVEQKKYKSSYIIHASVAKIMHQWQSELVEAFINKITALANSDDNGLIEMIRASYLDFSESIKIGGYHIPTLDDVTTEVFTSLKEGFVGITKINSENEIAALLNNKGQLRLDNPFNIFVGGQILDRGITVDNLIGFFYGRNPRNFQQDTVLQHSRMYGARDLRDMVVTRFYTSLIIYNVLNTMHFFDTALREAFEKGIHNGDDGVVFIESDRHGNIRPCSPSKILITSTQTIRPHSRFLPVGFQTKAKTNLHKNISKIDALIESLSKGSIESPFIIENQTAIEIIELISSTFEYSDHHENEGMEWEYKSWIAILRRLQDNITANELKGKIYCYVQKDRNMSRKKDNGFTFSDAPDDGKSDRVIAKECAKETACLILLRQNGLEEKGWRGTPFWWPVLVTPENSRVAIFSTETPSV